MSTQDIGTPELNQKLAAARLAATRAAPYFSHALLSLVPVWVPTGTLPSDGSGTIACTEDYVLLLEPGAVERWSVKEFASVLLHEVGHLLRLHFKRRGARDPQLSNLSEDCEINDDLKAMGLPLPDGGGAQPDKILQDFRAAKMKLKDEQAGLPPGKNFEWYYEQLEDAWMKQKQKQDKQFAQALAKALGMKAEQNENGDWELKGKPGHGGCGGCAGNATEHEKDHVPGDAPRRTKAEVQQISAACAHAVKEHVEAKRQGTVPAGIQRWAELHGAPPEIPWQERLRMACKRAVFYRPGAVDFKYNRPSRRQAGLGFGAGRAVMPALVQPVPQVAVMLDTSGSMGGKELESALRETDGVLKAVGAKIKLCVVDAQVHALQDVATIDQAVKLVKGGGGTIFNEAFEKLERCTPKPEVIIVMTDGYCGVPDAKPSAKVIWCLVGRQVNEQPAPWADPNDVVKCS